ncbi:MAG TPA: serine/threonine-protein kinase [Lysobacter sp.]|nr:serine/threonine-protein kinase [Lysobacter sp.]
MDNARWQRLSPLLDELFDLPSVARAQRLQALRAEDEVLADEIEALIALEDGQEDFLSEPVMPPIAQLRAGAEVGPYRLEGLLGEGGMGQVWLAARADGLYQRRVALKLLRPGLVEANLRLRFTRERQILARLAHPHIARLLDAGLSASGLPYLALEYVDGIPITDYCREQRVPLAARLRMFSQICDAVSHAHANLIVHRDLKPSNILVTPAGEVRLLDFGIAKLLDTDAAPEQTRTGVRAFTLHYAAPEQIRGEPVTTMTDVYSLGVVLFELLTDHKPYRLRRNSDAAWEEAILAVDPLRPSQSVLRNSQTTGRDDAGTADASSRRRHARVLAGDLDNIVLKTLSKRAEHRYPSVEALSQDLLRHASGRPVHARPQSLGYRMQKYLRRHRWSLASALLMVGVLGAALMIVAWQAREAVREASRAQAMQNFMLGVFENAGGARDDQPLDLRELLNASIERGNRELLQQPRARAELLGVVARLRTGLGDYEQARDLLEQQAAIIANLSRGAGNGIPASLRLESLTQRGRVLRLLGDPRGCIDTMQPHLPAAQREQAKLPPQAAEFYSQLGRCRAANGERRSARRLFERSLALRRDNGDRTGEIENLLDLSGLLADTGQTDSAMQGLQAARAQLLRDSGDRHPLLIDVRRDLGSLHRSQGALGDAEREVRAALTVSSELHGPQHPTTLSVRRQLARIHSDQGRFSEALVELRGIHAELERRLPENHQALASSLLDVAQAQWQLADLAAARRSARQALAMARRQDNPAATSEALFHLATILHQAGRGDEARPLLIEARILRRQRYGPEHPLVGDTERLLGEVEIALGQAEAGRARLARAVMVTRDGYGPNHPHSRQAELALAIHDAKSAPAGITRVDGLDTLDALAKLPQSDLALRGVAWRAQAHAAGVRCGGPPRAEALQRLRSLGMRLQQAQPEGGVIAREVAAIQHGCGMPLANESGSTALATP